MKADLYSRTILTIIAMLLAVIAIRPIFQPDVSVSAQGASGVQMT
jgi:hypothetical protein